MIFVTVGTQLPFDRLIRGVDAWAAAHPEVEVQAQTGQIAPGGYHPRHMISAATLDPETFDGFCRRARLIVAHAGTGSLLKSNTFGTPVLLMPRRSALGEHRNDHQLATAAHFGGRPGVNVVHEEDEIAPRIDALLAVPPRPPALGDAADPGLVAALRRVIFAQP